MWLLTGGAGYIGSHMVLAFRRAGLDVVVLDNLSTGYREFVPEDVPFELGSVADPAAVASLFDHYPVSGVVHLAGLKYAGESVREPLRFYHENVTGMQVLLDAVTALGIDAFLLSSSSSWYGTPDAEVVDEDAPPRPESPYGQSKVISEWLLRAVAANRPTLRQTSLRYFNVVGSGPTHLLDRSPYNLFPRVFRSLVAGERPTVFGADYPTRDGTCVRDYVHVEDVADAHVVAAQRLAAGDRLADAYNIGRGEGSTVLEVLGAMRTATGIDLEPDLQPRRPGDPSRIIGSVERIGADLGWAARHDLADMVASAWAAWETQPALRQ